MKILLANYYGFEKGGAQKSTLLLAKALQEEGTQVAIASTKNYPGIKTEVFENYPLPAVFFQKVLFAPFLQKVIEKSRIDHVSAQDRLTSFGAVIAAKKSGKSASVVFRDYWFACTKSTCLKPNLTECTCSMRDIMDSNPVYRVPWEYFKINSIRKNIHLFDGVKKIAVSNAVKEKLLQSGLKGPVSVIPNIVEFKEPQNTVDVRKKFGITGKIVLFVGRFSYEKGIFQLLNVAKQVVSQNTDACFLLVGEGPLISQAKQKVSGLGLEKNVFFAGNVSFEGITDYYFQSDVVVVPSFMESFGRTAIEAFAAKKPVVSSGAHGLADIVDDGQNGFLADPKKTNKWSELILKLLENDGLSKRLGQNGFEKARKFFSATVVAKSFLKETGGN